jgi:hypothetical protein
MHQPRSSRSPRRPSIGPTAGFLHLSLTGNSSSANGLPLRQTGRHCGPPRARRSSGRVRSALCRDVGHPSLLPAVRLYSDAAADSRSKSGSYRTVRLTDAEHPKSWLWRSVVSASTRSFAFSDPGPTTRESAETTFTSKQRQRPRHPSERIEVRGRLKDRIGDQKIDVIVRRPDYSPRGIDEVAVRTGIVL